MDICWEVGSDQQRFSPLSANKSKLAMFWGRRMDFATTLGILIVVGMISAGQALLKLSSSSLPQESLTIAGILAFVLDPYFLAAIANYVTVFFLWIWVLRYADLSKAYPFLALTFAVVPLIGIVFFGERASFPLVIGIALILTGVAIIGRYA